MKTLVIAILLIATQALATPYVNTKINADGALGPTPNPSLTVLISDDYSHTVAMDSNLWYELIYQGSGTCYVRLMGTTTKASWVKELVINNYHSYLINNGTKYINYSGCKGTATANSLIHFQ